MSEKLVDNLLKIIFLYDILELTNIDYNDIVTRIRKYLTSEAVKTLVQCTVTVRLDYCNSLYCGLPLKTIKKLQLAQNAAARLIAKISPRESVSHILIDLHWLPVTKRCQHARDDCACHSSHIS